jgi:D-threo-aldose 1-dehydrogenase
VNVTALGFGGAALGHLYETVSPEVASRTVDEAYRSGIRYFDTAPLYGYGLSEQRLGNALRDLPRSELLVSTKVGRLLRASNREPDWPGFVDALPFEPFFDYSHDGILRSFEESLQRLGMDRVDVLFMHDIGARTHGEAAHPDLFKEAMNGGFRALDELRSAGVVGAIGLGVNEWQVCSETLAHADADCFLLAGRYTLLEQTPLDVLLPACERRGVSIIVGGPFNSGILAAADLERARYDYELPTPEIVARVRRLDAVCRAHGIPLASAALQFPLLHPAIATVIPGARSPEEVMANVDHLRRPIPEGLWRDLKGEGLLHPEAPVGRGPEH